MSYEIIKSRLREEINASKHTKVKLGEMIGISPEMLTEYCTTKKLPALDTFARLCKALDASADYILGLTDEL